MTAVRTTYSASLNFFGAAGPAALAAEYGSPLYVYNEAILRSRCREMQGLAAVPGFTACYSTKANGNPHLLRIVLEEGLCADAMSPGELAMLQYAGFPKERINYVCNNVSPEELKLAAEGASVVSVDSLSQLEAFGRVNPGGEIMVRINPGIGAGHHEKVITAGDRTKFGVNPEFFAEMQDILTRRNLKLVGLNQHIGSLFMEPSAYVNAVRRMLDIAREFPGLRVVDFGGGFGIPYRKYENEARLDLAELSRMLTDLLLEYRRDTGFDGRFFIEPGRYIAAECGLLLGTVHAVKRNGATRYAGTDLGFSVLARPIMYDSFHDMEVYPQDGTPREALVQTVVGNICETGDVLGKDRLLPELREGDLVGILDAGAYGHVMSSNYNQRLRPAEVLVREDGGHCLVRRRDTVEDLLSLYPAVLK